MAISALLIDYAACTVWNDAAVGGGGQGGSTTSASSSSGDADAGNPNDLGGLLLVDEALKVCTMAATNDALASSIVASLGLPIGVVNSKGFVHVASQSECLNWLAGPIPSNRVSISGQQRAALLAVVNKWPAATDAAATLSIQYLMPGDVNCHRMPARCVGQTAYVCRPPIPPVPSVVYHCGEGLFAGTVCDGKTGAEPGCRSATKHCSQLGSSCNMDTTFLCDIKTGGPPLAYNCGYTGIICGSTLCQSPDTTSDTCAGKFGANACSSDNKQLRICDGILYVDYQCDDVLEGSNCLDVTDGTIGHRCHYQHEECSPNGSGIDSCNDGKLTVCVTGKRTTVNCPDGATCAGSYCIAKSQ